MYFILKLTSISQTYIYLLAFFLQSLHMLWNIVNMPLKVIHNTFDLI